jgi:hypothetical protein
MAAAITDFPQVVKFDAVYFSKHNFAKMKATIFNIIWFL